MAAMTNITENRLIDGLWRGGALGTGGAVNSTAVVTGVWTATTAYSLGNIVIPHANMTGAGGKFLLCTGAGTSGSTNTLAVPAVGSDLTDSTVTWKAISGVPALLTVYVGLFTAAPSDTGGGTECSGGAYARATLALNLTNMAGTQSAGSTTASSGTGGTTSNNAAITFPAPSGANWGTVTHFGVFNLATGGDLLYWAPLTAPKIINNGDVAPSWTAGTFQFQVDN